MSENLSSLKQADETFSARKYAEATTRYEALAEKARQSGDAAVLVQALAMAARGYLIREQKEEGRVWLERAREVADANQPQGWSRYLGVRGRFEWKDGDKPQATETFRAMYGYCMAHELFSRAIDAAHMVAITGTQEEQIEWAKRGIEAAEAGGEEGWLGPLWNNLGSSYWDMAAEAEGDQAQALNAEALACLLKARSYHWKVGREINKLIADWAVGSAYRRAGDHEKARAWLRPVLAWATQRHTLEAGSENDEWVGWAHHELGLIAAAEGETELALQRLHDARSHLGAAKMEAWDEKTWNALLARIEELEDGGR